MLHHCFVLGLLEILFYSIYLLQVCFDFFATWPRYETSFWLQFYLTLFSLMSSRHLFSNFLYFVSWSATASSLDSTLAPHYHIIMNFKNTMQDLVVLQLLSSGTLLLQQTFFSIETSQTVFQRLFNMLLSSFRITCQKPLFQSRCVKYLLLSTLREHHQSSSSDNHFASMLLDWYRKMNGTIWFDRLHDTADPVSWIINFHDHSKH